MKGSFAVVIRAISIAIITAMILDAITWYLAPAFFSVWPGRDEGHAASFLVIRDILSAGVAGLLLGIVARVSGATTARPALWLASVSSLGAALAFGKLGNELSRSGTLRLEDVSTSIAESVDLTEQTAFMSAHWAHLGAIAGWIGGMIIVAVAVRRSTNKITQREVETEKKPAVKAD